MGNTYFLLTGFEVCTVNHGSGFSVGLKAQARSLRYGLRKRGL